MKRPVQHIIETISRKAFEKLLPDEWVTRSLSPDYGIDYMVEIFKLSKSTGKFFYVQLKGTSQKVTNDEVKINLKMSALQYYKSLPLPILFIVYSTKLRRFWGIWINEYLRTRKIKEDTQTLQLKFDHAHVINTKFIEKLETCFCLQIPRKVNVTFSSDHKIGELYHNILKRWLENLYPNLLIFGEEHLPIKVCFNYSYKHEYLSINVEFNALGSYRLERILLNEKSDFLNYPVIDYTQIPSELKEVLFLIATMFAEEEILVSLNLYRVLICDYSGRFKNPVSLLNIGRIASKRNRIFEFQELIKDCIEHRNYEDFQLLNSSYIIERQNSKTLAKKFYEENLLSVISLVQDNSLKGMFSYNLANAYRTSGYARNARKAFRYYKQARRLVPDYLNRDYWWFEVAGILFETAHYKWAQLCYLKARRLSKAFDPLIFAFIGDCFFFQCRFHDARKWLDRYLKSGDKLSSEFRLKHYVTKVLIDNKLENIQRNPQIAISLTNKAIGEQNDDVAVDTLERAINSDPLCGLAWFNLGVHMNKIHKCWDSLNCFLVCCSIQSWDKEAWLNALFLSLNLKEYSLFRHIIDAIRLRFGLSIFKDIVEFVKKQPHLTNKERKQLVAELQNMFEKLTENNRING